MRRDSCFGALLRRSSTAVACAALLAACGDSTEKRQTHTSVVSAKPKASVTGLVTDGSRKPIEGAQVTLHIGKETRETSTDETGRWSFVGIPAGSRVGIEIAAEGHATAWQNASLPSSAGEYPQSGATVEVGPTALFALDGTLRVRVVAPNGAEVLATGAQCLVPASWADWSTGVERPRGEFAVAAELSPGEIHCVGLPGLVDIARNLATLSVVIPPLDLDGDGIADVDSTWLDVEPDHFVPGLIDPELTVVLEGWEDVPEIVATNVPTVVDYDEIRSSVVDPDEALHFVFDRPVVVHRARVLDETGTREIGHSLDVESRRVRIRPAEDGWEPGQELNLELIIAGRDAPDRTTTWVGAVLVTSDEEIAVESVTFVDENDNGHLDPYEYVRVELSQVVGWALDGVDPPELAIFFDEDIDGSGDTGDSQGEWGYHSGLDMESAEPQARGIFSSHFTRFFELEWEDDPVKEGTSVWINVEDLDDPLRLPDGRLFMGQIKATLRAVSE